MPPPSFCDDYVSACDSLIKNYSTIRNYSTICNYMSSVWLLHDIEGVPHIDPNCYLMKETLAGAKRSLGCQVRQVDPLSPEDLLKIYHTLDLTVG